MIENSVVEAIAERIERELGRVSAARPALTSRVSRAENILVTHLSCRRQRMIRVRVAGGHARFLVTGSKGAVYVVDPADWSCTCPDHHRRGAGCKHSIACWALWRASASPAHRVEVLAEAGPAETVAEDGGTYEARSCSGCWGEGTVWDRGAQTWVRHGACSGTGRVRAFLYPKTRRLLACSGCGERFSGRELVEVGPEVAEHSLTVSEGERLCGRCAGRHGVL